MVKYWDKYTEMHGQQNVKKKKDFVYSRLNITFRLSYTNWPVDYALFVKKIPLKQSGLYVHRLLEHFKSPHFITQCTFSYGSLGK